VRVSHKVDGRGNELWRRPGKKDGHSATLNETKGVFFCFTSSFPLLEARAYSFFQFFTYLECDGDFKQAVRELVKLELIPKATTVDGVSQGISVDYADVQKIEETQKGKQFALPPRDLMPDRMREFFDVLDDGLDGYNEIAAFAASSLAISKVGIINGYMLGDIIPTVSMWVVSRQGTGKSFVMQSLFEPACDIDCLTDEARQVIAKQSGNSGPSQPDRQVYSLLDIDELSHPAALITALQDNLGTVTMYLDEGTQAMYGSPAKDEIRGMLLKMLTCAYKKYRKRYADKNKNIIVDNVALSLVANFVPESINSIPAKDLKSGMFRRFVVLNNLGALARRHRRRSLQPVRDGLSEVYSRLIVEAVTDKFGYVQKNEIEIQPKDEDLFDELLADIIKIAYPEREGDRHQHEALYQEAERTANKFALLHHIGSNDIRSRKGLSEQAIRFGCHVAREALQCALYHVDNFDATTNSLHEVIKLIEDGMIKALKRASARRRKGDAKNNPVTWKIILDRKHILKSQDWRKTVIPALETMQASGRIHIELPHGVNSLKDVPLSNVKNIKLGFIA
jgi:hypothetical protein